MPLRNYAGKIIGTFGISKDITAYRKMEMEIKEKNEELLAQEEELRQNLEEMQATQEELERQIEENRKNQENLEKEKYLMDALMDNVPEFIYFKDQKSKFIRNSTSHARQFGFSTGTEISGKSDFDFFADEHARPAYNDEQKIIRTGKPIINRIERKVRKDGSVSWVSTSKMPLRNKQGKIVGTFGISKDITDIKNMEFEIKRKLEENENMKKEFLQKEAELKKSIQELRQKLKKSGK
jgi:PAS domain S-box-containing protein